MTRDRQQDDRLRATMLERAEAESIAATERVLVEEARERLTEKRHDGNKRREVMHERAAEEIDRANENVGATERVEPTEER